MLGSPDVSERCLTRDAATPSIAGFFPSVFSLLPHAASNHAVLLVLSFFCLISCFCLDPVPVVLCLDMSFTQVSHLKKSN